MTNESKSATVDNYPVLDKWLQEQCAKCLTSFAQSSRNGARATMWSFAGGGTALVLCHPDGRGWDIYTSDGSSSVDLALRNAEQRLGLRGAADTDSADTSVFIVLRTPESFEGLADIQIEAVYADQDLAKAHCVANPSLRYEEAPISRRLPAGTP